MKALIVKSDGLIYAAEVPEEPELCFMLDKKLNPGVSLGHVSCDILGCQCDVKQEQHQKDLASAKETAILCADQKKAKALLSEHHFFNAYTSDRFMIHGIYPIEGLDWEVGSKCELWCSDCKAFDWSSCREKQVAILKESLLTEAFSFY